MTHPFEGIEGFDKFLKKAEKIVADHRTEYHGEYYMKGGILGAVSNAISSIGDAVGDFVDKVIPNEVHKIIPNEIKPVINGLRDIGQAGASIVGNYLLPGSSIVTAPLASKRAQKYLDSPVGKIANIGSGLAGGGVGSETTGIPASSGWSDLLSGASRYLPGNVAGSTLDTVSGIAGAEGPTIGSGIAGYLSNPSSILSSIPGVSSLTSSSSLTPLILGGNLVSGILGADAAKSAGQLQYKATQDAINRQTELARPYVDAGNAALGNYTNLLSSPEAQLNFVQNNPFYSSLADEAQRRLTQSQASKGKLGSGGTASALQDQLLQLGNGLVQQNLDNLQNLINTGYSAASNLGTNTANLLTSGAAAKAAGNVGAVNAGTGAYNNGINSLLALQLLNKYKGA